MKKKVGLGLIIVILGGGLAWWVTNNKLPTDLLSPLGIKRIIKKENSVKVVGFMPTWMVGKTRDYCDEINEMVFLGIEVDEKGDLVWDVQGKKVVGSSYKKQMDRIRKCGGKNILGIKLFDDNKINKLMASEVAIDNLILQVKETVLVNKFAGVNVDFEYMGDANWVLGDDHISFLKKLKDAGVGDVGVDVFANTVIKGDSEKIKRLVEVADNVIIMAYDFHRPGMDYAGPVAPIRSTGEERNIAEIVEKMVMSQLNKKKIILAYPLYGYEWKTQTEKYGSKTIAGWSQMASFDRVQKLIKNYELGVASEKEVKINYDEVSMTPWLSFKKAENVTTSAWVKVRGKWKKQTKTVTIERIHQIYYDDLRSLKIKTELAKQSGVLGVAFWALGYEGDGEEVWKLVSGI